MPNLKGNESSLVKFKPKWRSGKTQAIRVPIAIVDFVLECAREMDVNGNKSLVQVIKELKEENERLKATNTRTSDSSHGTNGNSIICTSETEVAKDADIAKQIGIDPSTVGKIRRGKLKNSKYKKAIEDLGFRPSGTKWIKSMNTRTSG